MKIKEGYKDDEFEGLLILCDAKKEGEWEEEFVKSVGDRFKQYGPDCYLSEKQESILKKIAARIPERNDEAAVAAEPPKAKVVEVGPALVPPSDDGVPL